MEPWQSWAAAVFIGGAAFLYYTKDSKYFMKAKDTQSSAASDQPQSAVTSRRRTDKHTGRRKGEAQRVEEDKDASAPKSYAQAAASGTAQVPGSASKKRKAGKTAGAPETSSSNQQPPPVVEETPEIEEDYGDKEWAAQLTARKTGVTLDNPATSKNSAKTQRRKNAKQNEAEFDNREPNGSLPEAGSSNGHSQAPAAAEATNGAPVGGDVSDMLEAPRAGPSVIRITGEEKPKRPQAQRQSQAPVQETKKQRQNRKKAEEQKLQREQDEKARQILLEAQRRTAREARGEPARNGLATVQAPAKNVWSASVQSGSQPNGSGPATVPLLNSNETHLLDTFDHDAMSTASSNDPQTNATTPATAASTTDQEIPSEEAQLEMLSAMNGDVGWSEVGPKGKKGKKKGQPLLSPTPTESSGRESNPYASISTNDAANGSDTSSRASSKPAVARNGFAALEQGTDYASAVKGHPDDSDWAVS